jgi:hypothetical protein
MLNQASNVVVERLLSRVSPKTNRLIALCARAHCQHGASTGLTTKHRALFFFSDRLTKMFNYI